MKRVNSRVQRTPLRGAVGAQRRLLPQFRRRGVATSLLDRAEQVAAARSSMVGIGVGLHPGYNAAQRLYVKRGYVPDGLGVTYNDRYVKEGEQVHMDDKLVLHFLKEFGSDA